MKLRSIAFYSLAALIVVAVIGVVHRHVGRLAPAPPVDVTNLAMPVAPIPLPVVAAPTILQSQVDDGELPQELDHAVARRPEPPNGAASVSNVQDSPPDEALLVPIPRSKP